VFCLLLLAVFFRMVYFAKFKHLSGNSVYLYYSNFYHIEDKHMKKPTRNSYVTLFIEDRTSFFTRKTFRMRLAGVQRLESWPTVSA